MMAEVEPIRIEEAGLNALQTTQQLFYDGWLLRMSAGKAKRARSVNSHFGSSLPLDVKIDHCERVYRERPLRVPPFARPDALEAMTTATAWRGRGLASLIVESLLAWAARQHATHAFLRVNDDNAPALAVYRRYGFTTAYRYHYRARPHECR